MRLGGPPGTGRGRRQGRGPDRTYCGERSGSGDGEKGVKREGVRGGICACACVHVCMCACVRVCVCACAHHAIPEEGHRPSPRAAVDGEHPPRRPPPPIFVPNLIIPIPPPSSTGCASPPIPPPSSSIPWPGGRKAPSPSTRSGHPQNISTVLTTTPRTPYLPSPSSTSTSRNFPHRSGRSLRTRATYSRAPSHLGSIALALALALALAAGGAAAGGGTSPAGSAAAGTGREEEEEEVGLESVMNGGASRGVESSRVESRGGEGRGGEVAASRVEGEGEGEKGSFQ